MKKKILLFTLLFTVIMLPQIVKAKNVDKYAKDGKIVFKSVKPKTNDELVLFFENLFYTPTSEPGFYVDYNSCNDDYTKCTFLEGENDSIQTELEIVYEYDENIKNIVDNLVSKLPANKDTYNLTEMELISYIYNDKNGIGSIADFSGELKKYIEYKNFGIDVRLGDDSSFYTMRGGNALFTYNGTIYYSSPQVIHVESNHIFYIPENSTNIIEAMKTRLQKNFKGLQFEIEELTFQEFIDFRKQQLMTEYYDDDHEWARNDNTTAEDYANEILDWEYLDDEAAYANVKNEDYVYHVKENGKELRDDFPVFFIVRKDSSKVIDNELITVDSKSNVTITTKETIPLDTLIQVSKITSGEQYDKIIKILSITDNEMFDLKLFSKSTNKNITKLDNGSFEVRIPISEKLQGKDLVVFYVDENDNIKKYQVTISDDKKYAIFNTDHFSIYTLTEDIPESEKEFNIKYDFNGGTRQGETEYIDKSVAIGIDITKENFIDKFGVTPPEGKELDAIEINGTSTKLGSEYLLDKDTVFKYLWKDIQNNETPMQDNTNTPLPDEGEPVPKTFDSITTYIILFVISIISLTGTIVINKKSDY